MGSPVTFTATSTDNNYDIWDFGDGSPVDTGLSVTHSYTMAAVFNVTHSAVNTECLIPFSDTQPITVLFVGVNDLSSDTKAELFPNPTRIVDHAFGE